jgi:hypothetical protein
MYQRALAAGGPCYGLNGEPAGEVTREQMAGGKAVVTAIEAKRARKAMAIAAEKRATRKVTKTASEPVLTKVEPAPPVPSMKPGRLGLAELKEAATGLQAEARNSGSVL